MAVDSWLGRLRVEIADGIAIVTLTNPPSNVLDPGMLRDLEQSMDLIERGEVRAVVVTGEGKRFSVGADISVVFQSSGDEIGELTRLGHILLDRIERLAKPVIVAINGHCLGGGLELALACHLRIASDRAKLGLPEITLGLVPGLGGMQRLPTLVGPGAAYELILTGRLLRAPEALRLGLVNAVVPSEQVLTEAVRLARRITIHEPAAVGGAIRCLRRVSTSGNGGLERQVFAALVQSAVQRRDARATLAVERHHATMYT